MTTPITGNQITALVLAGGRGARMDGADKGLQPFRGRPLVRTVLDRLVAQTLPPARIAISANRNAQHYAAIGAIFDAPVWADDMVVSGHSDVEFAGPLAAMLTGLEHAATPYLLTAPCDAPFLALSLCERLAQALQGDRAADLAVAQGQSDAAAPMQLQPLFCLLRRGATGQLAQNLSAWLSAGERQARAWIARQHHVIVRFDCPADDPRAFANANTLEQLQQLEDG
jgi:molybdopterin-guanine dinucleotide biosynthesis protein A